MLNSYVALDIETTGLNPAKDSIIEVGAIRIENGTVTDMLSTLVNPGYHIPDRITDITGIDDDMVKDADTIEKVFPRLLEFLGKDCVIVAHNANFDVGFLKQNAKALGYEFDYTYLDITLYLITVLSRKPPPIIRLHTREWELTHISLLRPYCRIFRAKVWRHYADILELM